MDINDLSGRHIAITGAASGIGLETAKVFAEQGAKVALLDRDTKVENIAKSIPGAIAAVMDVTSETSVAAAFAQVGDQWGTIDGLVNCAGTDFSGSILDTSPEQWNKIMAINLTGPFLVCRAAVPWLRKAKVQTAATIVTIASGLALVPLLNRTAYCGSKAGVTMFSKALALELAPAIRVNVVCPGVVDTPMFRNAWPDEQGVQRILSFYAIKKLPTPRNLAYSILFLTSEASSQITGIALAADGGRSFH